MTDFIALSEALCTVHIKYIMCVYIEKESHFEVYAFNERTKHSNQLFATQIVIITKNNPH